MGQVDLFVVKEEESKVGQEHGYNAQESDAAEEGIADAMVNDDLFLVITDVGL